MIYKFQSEHSGLPLEETMNADTQAAAIARDMTNGSSVDEIELRRWWQSNPHPFDLAESRQETTKRRIIWQTTGVDAMSTTEQAVIEKIRQLPPQRLAEVEDFVDFLRAREDDDQLARAASKASEAAFIAVWSNDDDAAYDRM